MFSCQMDECNPATCCCICAYPLPCLCQSCQEAHLSKPGDHWLLPLEAKSDITSPQAFRKVQNKIRQVNITYQQLQEIPGFFAKAREDIEAAYQEILYQLALFKEERLAAINQVAEQYEQLLNVAVQEVYGSIWKDFPESVPFAHFLSSHIPGDDKDFDLQFTVDTKVAQVRELMEVKWVLPAFGMPNCPESAYMLKVTLDSGEVVPVIVQPNNLLEAIFAEITRKKPDLPRNSFFVNGSELLSKSRTVQECRLSRISQIRLLCDLTISVTTETWMQTTIQVYGKCLVGDVIAQISKQFESPPGKLKALYLDQRLKKKQCLACCGLMSGAQLRIVRKTTEPFGIGVKLPDEEILKLTMSNSDLTVALLTDTIKDVLHLQSDMYSLTFSGQPLDAAQTLTYYSIQQNSVLTLVPLQTGSIQLTLQLPSNTLLLQADIWSRVAHITVEAERQTSLSLSNYRLLQEGKGLDERRLLASYDLKQGSVLAFALRTEFLLAVVRGLTRIELVVEKFDTVATVKDKIFQQEGVYPAQQELIGQGGRLENERTLESLQLRQEPQIRLKVVDPDRRCVLS